MPERFDILIVDGDVNLSSNLQDILEAEEYRTAVSLNAETALALCR
jgi:DNA-binding NtrC family response regulator